MRGRRVAVDEHDVGAIRLERLRSSASSTRAVTCAGRLPGRMRSRSTSGVEVEERRGPGRASRGAGPSRTRASRSRSGARERRDDRGHLDGLGAGAEGDEDALHGWLSQREAGGSEARRTPGREGPQRTAPAPGINAGGGGGGARGRCRVPAGAARRPRPRGAGEPSRDAPGAPSGEARGFEERPREHPGHEQACEGPPARGPRTDALVAHEPLDEGAAGRAAAGSRSTPRPRGRRWGRPGPTTPRRPASRARRHRSTSSQ